MRRAASIRVALGGALVLAFASLPCAPASAHLGHVVQRAERYLKLDLHPHGVRLVVSLTLGPSEMARVLSAADADRDGEVTRAEADTYLGQWGRGLAEELPLRVDGESAHLRFGDAYFDPIGSVRAVAGTVEMVGQLDVEGGDHVFEVRDGMRVQTFDRTDVTFQAREGVELLASGLGGATSVERRLTYGRDGPDRRLSVRARFPAAPTSQRPLALASAIGLGVAALLALTGRRRRRARR